MKRKIITITAGIALVAATAFAVEYIRSSWYALDSGATTFVTGGDCRVESVYVKFDEAYTGTVNVYVTLSGEEVLRSTVTVEGGKEITIVPEGLTLASKDKVKVESDPAGAGKALVKFTK